MPTPPAFIVTAEPERDVVRIRLTGFFTADAATGLIQARNAAHDRLRCGPNRHVTVVDLRDPSRPVLRLGLDARNTIREARGQPLLGPDGKVIVEDEDERKGG